MIYYLHVLLRDEIPERYTIRTRKIEWRNERTNDSEHVIGEFADASAVYDAAGDALIYKSVVGDFDKKIWDRDDVEGVR